jgi:hypothetical protein
MEAANSVLHICMPSRGAISVPTHVFLGNFNVFASRAAFGEVHQHIPCSMSVIDARNACLRAVEDFLEQEPHKDHWILWMDDDMDPHINAIAVLKQAICATEKMKENGQAHNAIGVISGNCCRKEEFDNGLIFSTKHKDQMFPMVDFTPGDIVEVEWCGLGFTLHRAELIKQLEKPYFTGNDGGAREDHDFVEKLRAIGAIPYVHTGLPIGHFCIRKQKAFFPYLMPPVKSKPDKDFLVALDDVPHNGHAEVEKVT